MCLICAELSKNILTVEEARRNLGELYTDMDKDHVHEVLRLIWQKEDEEYESIKDEGSD
tara:strand:+ start:149 stop:325 length:177 start_codon:yes stop_codon:yes gene_type:complete